MTRDTIIKLAREAGFEHSEYGLNCTPGMYAYNMEIVERFAALVAEHERKACAEHYLDIARKAIEEEREACARVVEAQDVDPGFKHRIAQGIRARSKQ